MTIKGSQYIADIDEIGNVVISSPTGGQLLTYQSGQWVNATPVAALTPTLQQVTTSGASTSVQSTFSGGVRTNSALSNGSAGPDFTFGTSVVGNSYWQVGGFNAWQMNTSGSFYPTIANVFSLGQLTNQMAQIWAAQVASNGTDMTFGTASGHQFNWYTNAAIRWRVLGASLYGGAIGDVLPEVDDSYELGNDTRAPTSITTYDLTVKRDTAGVNDAIDVYDNTGGDTFTGTAITVNLDTVRKNTDSSLYSLASDEVTIASTGVYLVNFRIGTDGQTGTARSIARGWIELDPATGSFAEIDGTRVYMYCRQVDRGEGTGSASLVLDVTAANSKLRLRVIREAGADTLQTITDGSNLTIVRLGAAP